MYFSKIGETVSDLVIAEFGDHGRSDFEQAEREVRKEYEEKGPHGRRRCKRL